MQDIEKAKKTLQEKIQISTTGRSSKFRIILPSSMFSLRHLLQSFSPHGLTISVSLFLFSNLCLPHLLLLTIISSFVIFSILFIPIIHLNILISVLSSKFCSAFLSAQVSLPYIRTGLMTLLYTAALSIIGILFSHSIPDFSRDFSRYRII